MNIRTHNGKEQVFCEWRRKWVRLTPEEHVRQWVLHSLVEDTGYPKSLIAVEHPIQVAQVSKRCDAVVLAQDLRPLCIIEFKAPDVTLAQRVFDQVAVYNRALGVRYFIISNGKQTYACRLKHLPQPLSQGEGGSSGYEFLEALPTYEEMSA